MIGGEDNMRNGNSTFSAVDCIQNQTAAGFTPEQAQAQAKEFENSRIDLMSVLATKEDIERLRMETEKEIKESEKEIIKYIDNQNLKTIAILGALIGILKFLPDFFN